MPYQGLGSKSIILVLATLAVLVWPGSSFSRDHEGKERLSVFGRVLDAHGRGLPGAEVVLILEGNPAPGAPKAVSGEDGSYVLEHLLPSGTLPLPVAVKASKPSYSRSERDPAAEIPASCLDPDGRKVFLANLNPALTKAVTPALYIAAAILLLVYLLIITEKVHRTLAALLGAGLMLTVTYTLGRIRSDFIIITFEDMVRAIDLNVIFLLMSMMLIVGILKVTGLFQWLAYRSYRAVRGNAYLLMVLFMAITAVISAFLDNVTTMLLIVPVTIQIARSLKLNPLGLLVPEVFASNIGGTATLIGDPPNIMIGSAAGLSFLDFVVHLASICLICLAVSMVYFLWFNRRSLASAQPPDRGGDQDYGYGITDKRLLIKTLAVLAMVIGLFFVHGSLGMEPSIAALMGAAVLIAISHSDIARLLEKEIEWPTLVFFMMLFVVVGGAKETGLIDLLVLAVQDLAQGSLPAAVLIILWSSALASAVIDNIPYTATIIPIVASLNQTIPGAESGVLWWALALGACLGGNGTMVGASANLVTVGLANRSGYAISFAGYLKASLPPMLITIGLCSVWLLAVAG